MGSIHDNSITMNIFKIKNGEVNLDQVAKLKRIEQLKKFKLFETDEEYQDVWNAAKAIKKANLEKPKGQP
jgi:hypothetical protein